MRWTLAAAGVGVVVVLLLAGLYVGGIGPFGRTSSGNGAEPTFQTAAQRAEASSASVGRGPWMPILAEGLVPGGNLSSSMSPSAALTSIPSTECTVTPIGSLPSSVALSASVSNRSSGGSPLWVILLKNSTGVGLVTWVMNGQARPLATLTGGFCGLFFSFVQPIPSGAVDSSVAAAAVMADGGYGFLAQHPHANLTMAISGSIAFSSAAPTMANWSVGLSTCPLQNTTGGSITYATFTAQVGITTGKVVAAPTLGMTNSCSATGSLPGGLLGGGLGGGGGSPGATPLGTAFAMGSVAEAGSGAGGSERFYYNSTVQSAASGLAASGLNWSDMVMSVETPSGATASGLLNATVFSATGCALTTYNFTLGIYGPPPPGTACGHPYSGSDLPVTSGEELSVETSTSVAALGDRLVFTGLFPFSGTVTLALP